jgi:4-amino-4-deoxy-L-arabinose transferase-like glycosyltransferase
MSRRGYVWLIGFILALALGLRLYQLGSVPHGVYIDEVAMLVDAKSVSQSGLDMHGRPWYQVLYPSYGDYKLPIYLWLASLSVKVLGVSDFALRLPSVLAGIGTVMMAGLITRELLTDKKLKDWAQVATMTVVAIAPWSILFSRTGFEGHVGQFLLATSIWWALLGRRRWWGLPMAAVIGGLATYSYFSVRFVWPVVFSLLSWLWVIDWSQTKKVEIVKHLGTRWIFPLALFGLLLIPMLKSPLYADSNRFRLSTDSVLNRSDLVIQSNVYRELAGNTLVDRLLFHRSWLMGRELLLNYADNLSPLFLFTTGDPNLRHGTGNHGLFLLPMLPCLLLGVWYLYRRHKRVLLLLGVWWLVALLPASVPETTPHALRSLNALVPISVIMGIGLGWLLTNSNRLAKWGIAVVLVIFTSAFTYHYFHFYAADSGPAWQQGYAEVVEQIFKQQDYDHLYVFPFDERFYLWMMAYGPQTAQDFHSWESQYFMFKQQAGVSFDSFSSWEQVPGQKKRIMVVGRQDQVEPVLARPDVAVVRQEGVNDLNQRNVYIVAVIEPRL